VWPQPLVGAMPLIGVCTWSARAPHDMTLQESCSLKVRHAGEILSVLLVRL